jgi:hypothetical protein
VVGGFAIRILQALRLHKGGFAQNSGKEAGNHKKDRPLLAERGRLIYPEQKGRAVRREDWKKAAPENWGRPEEVWAPKAPHQAI